MRHPPPSREAAFRAVYEQHGPAVFAYIARRVAREHVDDLASETFMVAWRKLPPDVEEPLPWLYAVARRVVLSHHRSLCRRRRLVERLVALTSRDAESVAAAAELGLRFDPALAAAFSRLTAYEQEALLLVAWEGLDHAQAARVVGCTAATFTVRLSRARSKLRAVLGDRPDRRPHPLTPPTQERVA